MIVNDVVFIDALAVMLENRNKQCFYNQFWATCNGFQFFCVGM